MFGNNDMGPAGWEHDWSARELFERADELFPFRECEECEEFLGSKVSKPDSCPECGCTEDTGSYRESQHDILMHAVKALFVDGADNVIVEGPTGIGKSPINVTMGRLIEEVLGDGQKNGSMFYTTPQKKLRNQLANDEDLQPYVDMLKSRRDYICNASGENCEDCPINKRNDEDSSCMTTDGCTYWGAKETSMHSSIAALTFSMLIVDSYVPRVIPTENGGQRQISFGNRDLLVVDECHSLEGQVASLHAGFTVSPWTVPSEVFGDADKNVNWGDDRFEDVEGALNGIYKRAKSFIAQNEDNPSEEVQDMVEKCENFTRKMDYALDEIEGDERPWVVDIDSIEHRDYDRKVKTINMKPVDVDAFLNRFIWSRAEKRMLTTATLPFRDDPERWADRIGLPGETEVITRDMPFPKEHRQIYTDTIIGEMSGDGVDENWGEIVKSIQKLSEKHKGEKGLIHTASYSRARRLYESLGSKNCMLHTGDEDAEELVERWEDSDKDILLSPSMTEGVDLYDDRCRWQVLLKVPYMMAGDSRVSYMLNERPSTGWDWYYTSALLDIMQSVGRGVRSPDDYCDYYVLDACFHDVLSRASAPAWFLEAINKDSVF